MLPRTIARRSVRVRVLVMACTAAALICLTRTDAVPVSQQRMSALTADAMARSSNGPHDNLSPQQNEATDAQEQQLTTARAKVAHNTYSQLTSAQRQELRTLQWGGASKGAREWTWWKAREPLIAMRSDGHPIGRGEATARLIGIQFEDAAAWTGLKRTNKAGNGVEDPLPLQTPDFVDAAKLRGERRRWEYCALESPEGSEIVIKAGKEKTCSAEVTGWPDSNAVKQSFAFGYLRAVMHNHPQGRDETYPTAINARELWADYRNGVLQEPKSLIGWKDAHNEYQLALTPSYSDMYSAWVRHRLYDHQMSAEITADTYRLDNAWEAIISAVEITSAAVPAATAWYERARTEQGYRLHRSSNAGPNGGPTTTVAVTRYSQCQPTVASRHSRTVSAGSLPPHERPELQCKLELWSYTIAWTNGGGAVAYDDPAKITRMAATGITALVSAKPDRPSPLGGQFPGDVQFSQQTA